MRSAVAGTVVAIAAGCTCAVSARAADRPPEVAAKAAIVVQPDTAAIVYAHDVSVRRPIASATKLMTALLVLEHLELDEVVTAVAYTPSPGESVVGLRAGERLTVADLLRALLLPSANDAAATLAVAVAGTERAFVALMNRRAEELGLEDTRYTNPIGLDSRRSYSSAADLVALALELRRHPFFVATTNSRNLVLHSGDRKRAIDNRNMLLGVDSEVDGIKTGHTRKAGYVLVGSATRDGVAVVSVVLGEPTEAARDADSLALLRYGLGLYRSATPVAAGRRLATADVKDQGDDRVALVAGSSARRVVARSGAPAIRTTVRAPSTVTGPLAAGARVGTIEVREGGRVVARVPLVTMRAVPRADVVERARAWLGRAAPVIVIAALAIGSLTLLVLRRRALRGRPSEGAKAS